MKYFIKFKFLALVAALMVCNSCSEKNDLRISDEAGTISISDYNVQFGNSNREPIEEGLKLILKELKVATKDDKLKGTLTYTFRCEPTGMIRWMAEGKSDLSGANQDSLKNKFTEHLMQKQIRFPELDEVTMIEATIKFE